MFLGQSSDFNRPKRVTEYTKKHLEQQQHTTAEIHRQMISKHAHTNLNDHNLNTPQKGERKTATTTTTTEIVYTLFIVCTFEGHTYGLRICCGAYFVFALAHSLARSLNHSNTYAMSRIAHVLAVCKWAVCVWHARARSCPFHEHSRKLRLTCYLF